MTSSAHTTVYGQGQQNRLPTFDGAANVNDARTQMRRPTFDGAANVNDARTQMRRPTFDGAVNFNDAQMQSRPSVQSVRRKTLDGSESTKTTIWENQPGQSVYPPQSHYPRRHSDMSAVSAHTVYGGPGLPPTMAHGLPASPPAVACEAGVSQNRFLPDTPGVAAHAMMPFAGQTAPQGGGVAPNMQAYGQTAPQGGGVAPNMQAYGQTAPQGGGVAPNMQSYPSRPRADTQQSNQTTVYARGRADTGMTAAASQAASQWGASQAASQWGASQGVKTFQSGAGRFGQTMTGQTQQTQQLNGIKVTLEPVEHSVLPAWYKDGYEGCGRFGKLCCSLKLMFLCWCVSIGMLIFGLVFWFSLGLSAPQTKMLAWAINKRPKEGKGVYEGSMFMEVYNPTRVDLHFDAIEGELDYKGYMLGAFTVTGKNGTYSKIPAGTKALFHTIVKTRPWEEFGTGALVSLGADFISNWASDANVNFDIPIHLKGGWIKTPVEGLTRTFTFDMRLACSLGVDLNRNIGLALGMCPSAHLSGPVQWHADRGMCLEHFDLNSTSRAFKRGLHMVPCNNSLREQTFMYDWNHYHITGQVLIKTDSWVGWAAQGVGLVATYETQCLEANAFKTPSVGLTTCDTTGLVLSQQFWSNATNNKSTLTLAAGWDSSALNLDCLDVDNAPGSPSQSKPLQLRRCQYSRSNASQTFGVPWRLCDIGSEWAQGLSEAQRDQLQEGASVCGDFSFGGGLRDFLSWYGSLIFFTMIFALCACCFRGYRVAACSRCKVSFNLIK